MIITTADIKKNPNYPSVIQDFIGREAIPVKKIFPEIGLQNFCEETKLNLTDELTPAINKLIIALAKSVHRRISSLTRYSEIKIDNFSEPRKHSYKEVSEIITKFRILLTTTPKSSFIIKNKVDSKITLNLPKDIINNKNVAIFKKGEGLFKVYQKINALLRSGLFIPMPDLDHMKEFKNFSSLNVGMQKPSIVFSSDQSDGAWDIATMSMRGVTSCQAWHQSNSRQLIGSILDPFTGIMYLTSGANFEGRGKKMARRSLVRFVVSSDTKKPALLVERMYPSYNKDVAKKFVSLIKKKTSNKISVLDVADGKKLGSQFYIPEAPILSAIGADYSYVDSGILYKKISKNISKVEYKEFVSLRFTTFYKAFTPFASGIKGITKKPSLNQRYELQSSMSLAVSDLIDRLTDDFDPYNRTHCEEILISALEKQMKNSSLFINPIAFIFDRDIPIAAKPRLIMAKKVRIFLTRVFNKTLKKEIRQLLAAIKKDKKEVSTNKYSRSQIDALIEKVSAIS